MRSAGRALYSARQGYYLSKMLKSGVLCVLLLSWQRPGGARRSWPEKERRTTPSKLTHGRHPSVRCPSVLAYTPFGTCESTSWIANIARMDVSLVRSQGGGMAWLPIEDLRWCSPRQIGSWLSTIWQTNRSISTAAVWRTSLHQ